MGAWDPSVGFGERVRVIREDHYEVRQKDIARVFGVISGTISDWERGSTPPDHRVRSIAAILGIPPLALREGGPDPRDFLSRRFTELSGSARWTAREGGAGGVYGPTEAKGVAIMALAGYLKPGTPVDLVTGILGDLFESGRAVGRSEALGGTPSDGG